MLEEIKDIVRKILIILGAFVVLTTLWALVHFPRATDASVSAAAALGETDARSFYEAAYSEPEPEGDSDEAEEDGHDYVVLGRNAGETHGIRHAVEQFVEEYGLQDSRVLEVGAGSGQLQDVVEDYTGLDIAASAARYFHKPFVQGSATDLPFADNEFDSAWTIWVLEHVDQPEKALQEMRRVVKPKGLLYLFPAWNCTSWAAEGYLVRPYSDFDLMGKMVKASLLIRNSPWYRASYLLPIRAIRHGYWKLNPGPTGLRYDVLTPNYGHYWTADSDATVSLDAHETMLWHVSRGDECLSCPESFGDQLLLGFEPLIIRVHK